MHKKPMIPTKTSAMVESFLEQNETVISEYGHSCVQITGENPQNTYTYSVGLGDVGWPELIVMSLSPQTAKMIINSVATYLKAKELRPVAGMDISEAVNVLVRLREVPHHAVLKHLKVALARANQKGLNDTAVTALQVVWPDREGRFPGDEGYDDESFPQKILEDE